MKARKSRSDAWHAGLTIEQQQRAFELCSQIGHKQAAGLIAQEFGLARAPSQTALSAWWRTWPLRKAFLDFGSVAEEAKRALRETPDLGLQTEQIEAVGQAVFTAVAVKAQDANLFAGLRKLSQRDRELNLDREKFELLKRKAEQAEATEAAVQDQTLSPEERARRIAEIYGRA